ncbi:MAG: ubiquinol-cytochrome C chaperone [Alphaproteobacteria bacterium]|nr:ubiquinol-cytochrome C chaperone [Alphaproteobacteria bacterium]
MLYRATVEQARQPVFYSVYGVPDTLDGRFELIALHIFFVLHRLKAEGAAARQLSQDVFDTLFGDMDRSLREMGVADLGVGRRIRAMAEALYGRMAAYEAGLAAEDSVLAAALRRNLYGTVRDTEPPAAALPAVCGYVRAAVRALATQPLQRLAAGGVTFPDVPAL